MPIYPKQSVTTNVTVDALKADIQTPFDVTLAVPATAEDLVVVPVMVPVHYGRIISLVNEGPGDVAIKAAAGAAVTDLLIKEGEAYSESNLDVPVKFTFINVTAAVQPRVRGVLWSGPAA